MFGRKAGALTESTLVLAVIVARRGAKCPGRRGGQRHAVGQTAEALQEEEVAGCGRLVKPLALTLPSAIAMAKIEHAKLGWQSTMFKLLTQWYLHRRLSSGCMNVAEHRKRVGTAAILEWPLYCDQWE